MAKLESFRSVPRAEFVEESTLYDLAERYLHLACECVADIGQHLIADLGLRHAESYRDVIAVLQEEGILEDDLAESLEGREGDCCGAFVNLHLSPMWLCMSRAHFDFGTELLSGHERRSEAQMDFLSGHGLRSDFGMDFLSAHEVRSEFGMDSLSAHGRHSDFGSGSLSGQ